MSSFVTICCSFWTCSSRGFLITSDKMRTLFICNHFLTFLQVASCWFRLYLYNILSDGPISMYIPKGRRITELPRSFWKSRRLLLTTSAHDPIIVSSYNCLVPLNDTLKTHAVFLQVWFRSFVRSIIILNCSKALKLI